MTDESDAYDRLPAKYEVRRVNHGKAYRAEDGTTNNLAESYFSRFRRCQIGQIHKVAPKYLDNYADGVPGRHPALEQRLDLPGYRRQVRPGPGESGLVRVLARQPLAGGKPGRLRASRDRPGGAEPVPAGIRVPLRVRRCTTPMAFFRICSIMTVVGSRHLRAASASPIWRLLSAAP